MSTPETEPGITSTFSNENLTVSVTKKPHCEVKFDVVVTPQSAAAAYQKAIRNINKEVSIPGFRKGKAPTPIILEKYSSAVQKEFADLIIQIGFNESLQLADLHPLKDGRITRPILHECSVEKGAHFTIEFESRSIIPPIDLEKLRLKKIHPSPITDREEQNALQNLLLQFAQYEPIEDRPTQEGDFVDLDVTILGDNPKEVIHNQRTQVVPTGLPSWLRQKVIGLKAGESAEGVTEQDLTLSKPVPEFKSLPFKVTVKAILNGNLPAVDEELAKKVGLESIDKLHIKLRERLEKEVEEEAREEQVRLLEEALVAAHLFDLPQSYIDSNKEARLESYFQKQKKDKRDYPKEELDQISQMIEESTIYHLQLFFLMRKVASEYQITLSQDDLREELTRQMALASSGRNSINFSGEKEEFAEQLNHFAFDRKIKEFLLNAATFSDESSS